MSPTTSPRQIPPPKLNRSLTLRFTGDWGQANFHRICSILAQEFCDRAGPRSRVCTWTIRHGGFETLPAVQDGETDLGIATPAGLVARAVKGEEGEPTSGEGGRRVMFPRPMPNLRALAVLPQNDSMVFAIHPRFGVSSFEELRAKKPRLRIATGTEDGTCFIGHVAMRFMEAHGIGDREIKEWGGEYVTDYRPDQSLDRVRNGEVDAVLQEAIMTPWWSHVIEEMGWVPLPAEEAATKVLAEQVGLRGNRLPKGYWKNLDVDLPTLDFSDFIVLVRDDMPEDVAYLLTWCLVEQRLSFERPYHHLPPHRSPLSYPLVPENMANSPVPLHSGAKRYYAEAGIL